VKESNRKGDNSEKKLLPGFLKKETMDTMLSPRLLIQFEIVNLITLLKMAPLDRLSILTYT
jgi:hypothetical protein